jgi:hypothetical protein
MIAAMSDVPCPVCQGETFEIRAKLVCRRCGTILETCCEGGPMGDCGTPASSAQPEPSADPRDR